MTTIDTHVAAHGSDAGAARTGVLAAIASWITTTDHKRIGRLYIVWALVLAATSALCGALLSLNTAMDGDLFTADAAPQLQSTYVFGLTFGALLPLVIGVAIAVVPLQVGARSIAFGRLVAVSFWTWAIGFDLIIIATLANGGAVVGDDKYVGLFYAGLLLALLGLFAAVVSLVTTILTTRAPGMNMRRVPLFTWSVLVFGVGLVVALPVFIGTVLYTYVDVRYQVNGFAVPPTAFDSLGFGLADPLAFGITAPMAILYALPVLGFMAEVVATASGKRLPMRQSALLGMGLVGITALVGVMQNNFGLRSDLDDAGVSGILDDGIKFGLFNLLPLLGGVIVLGVCLLALKSKPRVIAALPFAVFGGLMLLVGLLTNALGLVGDLELGGAYVFGVWLYPVYAGVIMALGALTYWGPKLWGRTLPTAPAGLLALMAVGGTVVAAAPLLISGLVDDDDTLTTLMGVSAAGHALIVLTIVAFGLLALRSFTRGDTVDADPYDGHTLEWAAASPAPADNFTHAYTVQSAEPLLDLKPDMRSGS